MIKQLRASVLMLSLLLVALAGRPVSAQSTAIKMATAVPEGTVWFDILKDMGSDWSAGTAGRVTLRLYPGGIAGDDPDMLRKMRIGQLQAAVLSTSGLSEIDDAFKVFRLPLFFRSYEELRAVRQAMAPDLERRLEAKGFKLLGWAEVGWVYFFSSKPVQTVADIKTSKMFAWAGDDQMVSWWKEQGFQPVAIASTDIPTALQTGMLQSIAAPPLLALTLQFYRPAPNMLQLGMGGLIGATVMNMKTWEALSPADQKKVLEAAARVQQRLEQEVPKQDATAIEEMKKRGLNVVPLDATQEAAFRQEAERLGATQRGVVVPADAYDTALAARNAFRKTAPAGAH